MKTYGVFVSYGNDKRNLIDGYFVVSADNVDGAKNDIVVSLKKRGIGVALVTGILEIEKEKEKWQK